MFGIDHDSIYFFRPHPSKQKQPQNPFSLSEQLGPGQTYDRVKNHLILGQLCEFVPQVIIPNNELLDDAQKKGDLTLEKIKGLNIDEFLSSQSISLNEFIELTQQFLSQVKHLYQKFGLLLSDRSLSNGMLSPVLEDGTEQDNRNKTITIGGKKYKLYQIDLELMYDITDIKRSTAAEFRNFSYEAYQPTKYQQSLLHEELATFISSVSIALDFQLKEQLTPEQRKTCFQILYSSSEKFRTFESVETQLQQLRQVLS